MLYTHYVLLPLLPGQTNRQDGAYFRNVRITFNDDFLLCGAVGDECVLMLPSEVSHPHFVKPLVAGFELPSKLMRSGDAITVSFKYPVAYFVVLTASNLPPIAYYPPSAVPTVYRAEDVSEEMARIGAWRIYYSPPVPLNGNNGDSSIWYDSSRPNVSPVGLTAQQVEDSYNALS
jgi:hypothetical protein